MKKSIGIFFILFLISCGSQQEEKAQYDVLENPIIQGYLCSESEFPSSVELILDAWIELPAGDIQHVVGQHCGGTLIKPQVVLTAAHCLNENQITQGFGKILRLRFAVTSHLDLRMIKGETAQIPKEAIWASFWLQHNDAGMNPLAVGLQQSNDIGLLFLSKPMNIEPVKLIQPEEIQYVILGAPVIIVGWGKQVLGSEAQNPLTAKQKMCAQTRIEEIGVFEMKIGTSHSPRKCFGDSGGATYLQLPNGEYRLVGVTSHSYDRKNECRDGSVDVKFDSYFGWIYDTIKYEL